MLVYYKKGLQCHTKDISRQAAVHILLILCSEQAATSLSQFPCIQHNDASCTNCTTEARKSFMYQISKMDVQAEIISGYSKAGVCKLS